MGEDYPLVPNTSAQARAQNRRVEVTLAGGSSWRYRRDGTWL